MNVPDLSATGSESQARVMVLGTLNIDHVWTVARLPKPGETVLALSTQREFGGKGANQAVAAARQGARVSLVGAVGADAEGQRYREYLEKEGIDTSALLVSADVATGTAHVYVDQAGENLIVVDGGANRMLKAEILEGSALRALLKKTDVLLAQLEAPLEAVRHGLRLAEAQQVRIILNASPFNADFRWDIAIDTVIVNEHECANFFGLMPAELEGLGDAERRAFLKRHRLQNVVVTQGARATLLVNADTVLLVPTHQVEPKDTVGAGDTFAGVLAVRLAAKVGWREALWQANVAAALSTTIKGAQTAMPNRRQVEAIAQPASVS